MPRLLVLEHESSCPPGWIGDWAEAGGCPPTVCRPYLGQELPSDVGAWDGLVVLGGEMGAYDDARHPWLTPTKALIARAAIEEVPFLGVCLGHQLAAVALGGRVGLAPSGRYRGLRAMASTAAAGSDPVFCRLPDDAWAVHWNDDVVTGLPHGATVLSFDPTGAVQVARYGPVAWGVQCHPEAGSDVVARWATSGTALQLGGLDLQTAWQSVAAAEDDLRRVWRPVVEAFVEQVHRHAQQARERPGGEP